MQGVVEKHGGILVHTSWQTSLESDVVHSHILRVEKELVVPGESRGHSGGQVQRSR